MKKIILSTLAAGALVAGGAVHADDPWTAAYNHILGSGVWQGDNGVAPRAASPLHRDKLGTYYYDTLGQKVYVQGAGQAAPYAYNNGVPYVYGQLPRGHDRDGDGVRNRYDRDRDGDGLANRYDRHPNNPRRR